MKSLQIIALALFISIFSIERSNSEPIQIKEFNEVVVPVICHNKEAFLEVIKAFIEEGQYAGLVANRLNMRMQICYSRPVGFRFQPEKQVAEADETEWTLEGVVFEGKVQRADETWTTMYAWIPITQLRGIRKGKDA